MKTYILLISLFGLMTTSFASEPVLLSDPGISDNCTLIDDCEQCLNSTCHWVQCLNEEASCQLDPESEFCKEVSCTVTTTTEPITTEIPSTTPEPTTTAPPTEPTTTPSPTTTSTPPSTTDAPTEQPTEPPTTEPITTAEPTTMPPATTTAKPCPPEVRHFDAPSFFGGMVLAVGILAIAYAAWRFYKSRNERNYHTLQTVY